MIRNYTPKDLFKKFRTGAIAALFLAFSFNSAKAQLVVNSNVTPAQLISALVGQGLTISNINLNCPTGAYGTFNGSSSNIGMTNGILLTTGQVSNAVGPNNTSASTFCNGTIFNDPQLQSLEPLANEDVCILEFDLIPQCSSLQIRFVFGSEEYPEWVSSGFNDAFGFFITGPGPSCQPNFYSNTNVATLPNNTTIVSIDNVNNITNNTYYFDNTGGTTVQYDGFTTVLTRNVSLCACSSYHFKIAIGDAGDCSYDSGVFLDFIQCANSVSATSTSTATGCSCTGTATANAVGGQAPYTYSWAPGGQTTATATGLCAGTYTCFVNDALVCTTPVQTVVTVTGTTPLTQTVNQTNIACFGVNSGSITVTASGAPGPYTYVWTPNVSTTNSATGLSAGSYTVLITASNGCTSQQVYTITSPTQLTSTQSQVNLLCAGTCNGSASVIASGGTSGYSYNWTPSGGTTANATGLCAGNYTCTITDANGCTRTNTFTITTPSALTSTQSQVNLICNNQCNGTASVVASGGTSGYTYNWTPSGGTAANATGLCAGNYTCTITDANGCTRTNTFTISQPSAITGITVSTTATCGQSNGTATVNASGGTPGYTYSWAPTGGTGTTATGLAPNTYTVYITDANGCSSSATVTVSNASTLSATVAQSGTIACFGGTTATAVATPTGGTSPYTYSWSNSQTTATATGLGAGTYTVTITDATGCITTQTITISQPTAVASSIPNSTNATCSGNNGSATASASGGTPGYTYSWAPSGGTTTNATGLGAGTYTVFVTDANGCTSSSTITITSSSNVTLATTGTATICIGQTTTVTATATGGNSPYAYTWTPGNQTGSSVNVNPTTTTTYTVIVTDLNGCTATQNVTVTVNPPLAVSISANPTAICLGGSTTITTGASGGNGNYTYSWAPSGTGSSVTVSPTTTTTYTVTVSDNCGTPIATNTITITVNQPPVVTFTATPLIGCSPLCVNFINTTPNTSAWSWNFGVGTSTQQTTNFCFTTPGTYTVSLTVTATNGCTNILTNPNYVTVLPNPVAAFSSGTTTTYGAPANVCFTDNSTGATTWTWNSGTTGTSNQQNPCFTYPDTGTFCATLIVTNQGGCSDSIQHCINVIDDTYLLEIPNIFTPNGDGQNDIFQIKNSGIKELDIHIYNRWGNLVYEGSVLNVGWDGSTKGGKASDGTYFFVLTGLKNHGETIETEGYVELLNGGK